MIKGEAREYWDEAIEKGWLAFDEQNSLYIGRELNESEGYEPDDPERPYNDDSVYFCFENEVKGEYKSFSEFEESLDELSSCMNEIEERYIILVQGNSHYGEDIVLPKNSTEDQAIARLDEEWEKLTDDEKRTTQMRLGLLAYNTSVDAVLYNGDYFYDEAVNAGYDIADDDDWNPIATREC